MSYVPAGSVYICGLFFFPCISLWPNVSEGLRLEALYRLQQPVVLAVAPSFLLDSLLLSPQLAFLPMSSGCCY